MAGLNVPWWIFKTNPMSARNSIGYLHHGGEPVEDRIREDQHRRSLKDRVGVIGEGDHGLVQGLQTVHCRLLSQGAVAVQGGLWWRQQREHRRHAAQQHLPQGGNIHLFNFAAAVALIRKSVPRHVWRPPQTGTAFERTLPGGGRAQIQQGHGQVLTGEGRHWHLLQF